MNTRPIRRSTRAWRLAAPAAVVASMAGSPAGAQAPRLEGTWSSALTTADDPAWLAEDFFCFIACTPAALAGVTALLQDPANARRSSTELFPQVVALNIRDASSRLSGAGLASPASFAAPAPRAITCDAHGFATQVLSPLPLRIEQQADGLTLRYEEFGARRSLSFAARGRGAPASSSPTPLGVSTARFEGDSLVVETTQIPAGRLYDWFSGSPHGDELRAVERYTTSEDGSWLNLELTLEDPATFREPLVLVKRWRRTPAVELLPYSCDAISGQR